MCATSGQEVSSISSRCIAYSDTPIIEGCILYLELDMLGRLAAAVAS